MCVGYQEGGDLFSNVSLECKRQTTRPIDTVTATAPCDRGLQEKPGQTRSLPDGTPAILAQASSRLRCRRQDLGRIPQGNGIEDCAMYVSGGCPTWCWRPPVTPGMTPLPGVHSASTTVSFFFNWSLGGESGSRCYFLSHCF